MNYPRLKAQSPPAARVAAAAMAALVIFTLFSAISGTHSLLASTKNDAHYSIRIDAEQSGDSVILQGRVTDNATQTAIAAPRFTFPSGQPARATVAASGRDITFDVRPSTSRRVEVEVTIRRGDELEQRATIQIIPAMVDAQPTPNRYSGAPISLRLTNAEIRDLLRTFGQLADLDIRPDPDIAGIVVSVNWVDVPWDQAFESILEEHGLKYTIDGSVIHVSKK